MDLNTTPKSSEASEEVEEQTAETVKAPPRSSHVIDLRQGGSAKSAERRVVSSDGAKPEKPIKKEEPVKGKPAKSAPESDSEDLYDGDVLSSPQNQRRFWPAFARFLALLIVLGLIIAGGVYLYVTYYKS